jgi:hypothetical protein
MPDYDLLDAHHLDTITEGLTIRIVPVSQQKARRGVPGERFGHLVREPDLGRILGDIKMNDLSAVMAEDDGREEILSRQHWGHDYCKATPTTCAR